TAYRYFFCDRIQAGEGGDVWLPQGQTLSALQQGVLGLLKQLPAWERASLREQVNWFGRSTLALTVLLQGLIFLVTGQLRGLGSVDKLLVLSTGLFPLYVLRHVGFWYNYTADYFTLTGVLVSAATLLTIWQIKNPDSTQ